MSYWVCPNCGELYPEEVTLEETCMHCESEVEFVEEEGLDNV